MLGLVSTKGKGKGKRGFI